MIDEFDRYNPDCKRRLAGIPAEPETKDIPRLIPGEYLTLHPAELALIEYIRGLQFGSLTIKVQHGLPEVGEEVRAKVMFNRKGGK